APSLATTHTGMARVKVSAAKDFFTLIISLPVRIQMDPVSRTRYTPAGCIPAGTFMVAAWVSPGTDSRRSMTHRRRSQYLTPAIGAQRRNHSCGLHGLHQARSPVITDFEAALHRRNRGAARLRNKLHRLVVERVLFGIPPLGAIRLKASQGLSRHASGENFIDILRLTASLPGINEAMHIIIVDKTTINTRQQPLTGQ